MFAMNNYDEKLQYLRSTLNEEEFLSYLENRVEMLMTQYLSDENDIVRELFACARYFNDEVGNIEDFPVLFALQKQDLPLAKEEFLKEKKSDE